MPPPVIPSNHQCHQKMNTISLSDRELATVLAALRFYQSQSLADCPDRRPTEIQAIATDGLPDGDQGLDAIGIDALCERLNVISVRAPSPARPPGTGRLFAPNGCLIVAAKDWIPGNALLTGATRHADGSLEIEWSGETVLCWDGQYTEELNGQRLFLDENTHEWREDELTLAP